MARHNHSGALAGPGQESPGKTGGRGLLDRLMAVEKAIAGIEIWVVIAALAVIILAVLVSVLIRSFALALPDTGEIAIVAMSPLTFVGGRCAAICTCICRAICWRTCPRAGRSADWMPSWPS